MSVCKDKGLLKSKFRKRSNLHKPVLKNMALLITLLIISVFLSMSFFSGCNKKDNVLDSEHENLSKKEAPEEIPDELQEIEYNIEMIIGLLDGPAVGIQKEQGKEQTPPAQKAKKEEGDQNNTDKKEDKGGGDKNKDRDKDTDKEGSDTGSGEDVEQTDKDKKDPWKEIEPIINKMHYTWNSYMPQVVKKSIDKQILDNFSSTLNSLTDVIKTKDRFNTLLTANHLYSNIPEFFALYKTKYLPEVKRIRCYVREATLNAVDSNWSEAEIHINNLKSTWAILVNMLDIDNENIVSRLDFSIIELEKVILAKNQNLSDIKGRITLVNIEDVEKNVMSSLTQHNTTP